MTVLSSRCTGNDSSILPKFSTSDIAQASDYVGGFLNILTFLFFSKKESLEHDQQA